MFKRIFLFLAVNLLVVTTISITLSVLGLNSYLTESGLDYQALLAFCAVWGFVGAFISLALSKVMAKFMMGVKIIDPSKPGSADAKELVQLVHRHAQKAGLAVMPEVGFYDSPEVNAFATGPTKNRALVAVSSGLLNRMDGRAVEGVIGHEISHIANGDMVTMTLIQGIINTFVMFFARVAGWVVTQAISGNRDRDERPSPFLYFIVTQVFEVLLSLLGWVVVAYFSRWREYRADAGSARIAGRDKMIHALESLKSATQMVDDSHQSIAALKISGRRGFLALFATHPELDDRIKALRSLAS